MTIVFLARRFYPLIGGVEKHVMEISKRLVAAGHRVIVVTEEPPSYKVESYKVIKSSSVIARNEAIPSIKRLPRSFFARNDEKEIIEGIEIYRINVCEEDKFKKFRIWKGMWKLRDVIGRADVIHCHDVFFWYLPFRLLYPRKSVYTTFHGYESYPIRRNAIVVRKISELLSWGNICIGDFIPKWYHTKPTYLSYGAVDLPSVIARKNDEAISSTRLPRSYVARNDVKKESALFFGRLDNQTGILEYIKAFELLKKKFPKFTLLVVGDGEQTKLVEKKVKTTGFQNNPETLFDRYHFAFVSRYLSILEALVAKRPVIAVYDNPVKEDYLRMAPYAKWIIIEKEPAMIAKRIEELLANPEKEKKMVESAYRWVKKQSWEEMVRVYLKLWGYREALS